MGLTFGAVRRDGTEGLSLAEVKRAVDEAVAKSDPELDLGTVIPKVAVTPRGKIKKIEIEIP